MGTLIGLGVNLVDEAAHAASFVDGDGKSYSGANRYPRTRQRPDALRDKETKDVNLLPSLLPVSSQ
jgi:hypothetical protein